MTVIFLASDETDDDELTETNQLKYQFIPEEISDRSDGKSSLIDCIHHHVVFRFRIHPSQRN